MSKLVGEILEDGTEILHDQSTGTTRWVLYRSGKTKQLVVAIVQGRNVVGVNLLNLRCMALEIAPKYEQEETR